MCGGGGGGAGIRPEGSYCEDILKQRTTRLENI